MNILQLTHRLPYPLIDGGKIGIFNFTKFYNQLGNKVHLICIGPNEERSVSLGELELRAETVKVFYKDLRNKKAALIKNLLSSPRSYNIKKYEFLDVKNYVLEFLRNTDIDVVHVDHLHIAYYAREIKNEFPQIPIAIREHNVEYKILERFYQNQKNPLLRSIFKIQCERLKKYERSALRTFDAILAITPEDSQRIQNLDPQLKGKIYVIPAGVDVQNTAIVDTSKGRNILHMAAMDWLPNQEGLLWFIRDILPGVVEKNPGIKLWVVGKNTPDSFKKYENENIKVLGFVENADEVMGQCRLAIVPLSAGGGMRVKILNYLAAGMPVVSTSIGAEGINVKHGEHILIADTAEQFVRSVEQLLTDDQLRETLARNGRQLIEKEYAWESIVGKTLKIFDQLLPGAK